MTASRDVVVIGGGHNGLVAAAYLARSGLSTLVCERRGVLGGAAVSEHPFGPDYTVTSLSYVVSLLPPGLVRDLRLARHGYHVYPQGPYFAPRADGRYLSLPADPAARRAQIAKFSAGRRRSLRAVPGPPGAPGRDPRAAAGRDPAPARVAAAAGPVAAGAAAAAPAQARRARRRRRHPPAHRQRRRPGRALLRQRRHARAAVGVRRDRGLGRAPVERHGLRDAAPPHRRHRRAGGRVGLPARRHGRGHRGPGRRGPLARRRDPHRRRGGQDPHPRGPGDRGDPRHGRGHRRGDRRHDRAPADLVPAAARPRGAAARISSRTSAAGRPAAAP